MTSTTTLSRPEPAGTAHNVVTDLAKLGLALRHESWRRRERSGLTPTQAEILVFLRACGERGVRLTELAEGLGVTAATASESLRSLHRRGSSARNGTRTLRARSPSP